MRLPLGSFLLAGALSAQPIYDLLLKGGQVIDPKNNLSGARDVAIAGGKIARVAASIPAEEARTVADVKGLYVTPGLIDIHVHVYTGTGERSIAGDQSVYPDGFSFRAGVTTMVDAGTAGWSNFEDFLDRVIRRARTRVFALLNVSAVGMAKGENDIKGMDPEAMVRMAKAHPDVIVGFKTAHFAGPGWEAMDALMAAGKAMNLPVMVDFGNLNKVRNLRELLLDKLRPGDIYTHCYSGLRTELVEGRVNPVMIEARKRGVVFDLGHGGGSFFWWVAVPAFEQKFYPDIISTDLHTGSMNGGMKDMVNVMSKALNLGVPVEDVIRMSTWNPATHIRHPELGHLDLGAVADVTVLKLERGEFGFPDSAGGVRPGNQRLTPDMTVRAGAVVWDLNGRAGRDWKSHPYKKR
jgi:dihydroorotase